jgi:hypothetical protein
MAGPIGYGYRQVQTPTGEKDERKLDAGENPPNGVIVHYWLREAPAGDLVLAFLDADGREIRSFTSKREPAPVEAVDASPAGGGGEEPTEEPPAGKDEEPHPTKDAGANRFVWNLRGPDATKLPDNKGRGGSLEMLAGPRVPPGPYQVRLLVNGRTLTQRFEVVKDPRVQATDAAIREAFDLAKQAHDLLIRVHDAVLRLRDVRTQAEGWGRRAGTPTIKSAAIALVRTLTAIERELIQVRSDDPRMFPPKLNTRIGTVIPLVEYSDAAPTQALRDLTADLTRRAEAELAKLADVLTNDVGRFNALCRDGNVAAIVAAPAPGG